MASTEEFDVVVFGGGSGLTTATLAADAGKSVCVVEERKAGGTCENRGCIPTKGLIQSAEVLRTIRHAAAFGVHVDMKHVRVDFAQIMDQVRARRKTRTDGAQDWAKDAFTYIDHHAEFVDGATLRAGEREVTAGTWFLAMGASPAVPPIPGLDAVDFLTNESVLELKEQPAELIILGGGYIGAEFAHFFHQVGTKVTVIESKSCLLQEDGDVRSRFTKEFATWVTLLNGWRAVRVEDGVGDRISLLIEKDGQERTVSGDALLVATGRTPNTKGIGLQHTKVAVDERGFVKVDEFLHTTDDRMWALGDVTGKEMFKHTAAYEAELAWRNSQGAGRRVDHRANPHAIFTYPQIGSVGMTEEACKEAGIEYKVGMVEYGGVAKGQIVGSPTGFAKAIVEGGSDRILGFHMMGPHAADLIAEAVVAMNAGDGRASNVLDAIHTHPTMSELVKEAFVQAT